MRIGVYGGSFNPIHRGHTALAQSLVQQGLLDEVWLLVSPLNPLKQSVSTDIAPYEHRIRMAELATKDMPGLKVSDFESHLPIPSYTITTLDALCQAFPQHDFVLVIGADNWQSFGRWHKADEIVERYQLLVYRRPGCDIDENLLPPSVRVVDTPLYDISSTQIRQSVQRGHILTKWVNKRVASYINEHQLYI